MESQQASAHRRINLIASHLLAATHDDFSLPNLLRISCSSSSAVNFASPRGDNRMYFARQGSNSQAFFMRQVSPQQDTLPEPDVTIAPPKGLAVTALNRLMYSRVATLQTKYPSAEEVQPLPRVCSLSGPDRPKFARPHSIVQEQDLASEEQVNIQKPVGTQWSPKMDVVETQCNYVVTAEVPGIGIDDIRVEVNNQNLVVMGKRATQWWKIASCSSDSLPRYHKKSISQGSYQVQWPLPADANRDNVSAQFVNGILQITIPKLQACCA
uniref:SHSP domain-containing protein n=1 Tax=Kalanchoe fedtschenkoi TaxID=63787 RepID=A0A7N0TJB6_KALFE